MAPGAIQNTSTPAAAAGIVHVMCSSEAITCQAARSKSANAVFATVRHTHAETVVFVQHAVGCEARYDNFVRSQVVELPVWVFSAANCLARKATAALLIPSASLMPTRSTLGIALSKRGH